MQFVLITFFCLCHYSFTSNIEAISCDELYIDVTKTLMETGASPLEFAQLVKDEIFAKTQCTASVGIGT